MNGIAEPAAQTKAIQTKRSKTNTIALVIIATIITAAAITYAGPVLQPLLIAVFLFFTLRPLAEFLHNRGLPYWIGYTLLLILVAAAFFGLGYLIQGTVHSFRDQWPLYSQKAVDLIDSIVPGQGQTVVNTLNVSAEDMIRILFGTALNVLEFVLMTFFYLVFLILDVGKMGHRLQRALAAENAEHVVAVAHKIADQMGYFMRVKTAVSLGLGLGAAAILAPFGVEYWVLWAFLFFLLNYITYVGSIVACVPPIAVALLQFHNPWLTVAVGGLLILNRILWIDLIELRFMGKKLNVDSSLLLAFLAYWGWSWGIVGLLLAVPLLTSLKIVLANISDTWPLARLMSEE